MKEIAAYWRSVAMDVENRLPFYQSPIPVSLCGYLGFSPAPAMAVAIWNFLCRLRSGILIHVDSSFQAVDHAAGCFNIAAAFC